MKPELKTWCQQHHAECLAQLALFPPGREALLQNSSVSEALQAVAESGLSPESREFAQGALLALSDTELISKEGQKHVMLSCASNCLVTSLLRRCLTRFRVRTDQWDVQTIVQRINESLIRRGYVRSATSLFFS